MSGTFSNAASDTPNDMSGDMSGDMSSDMSSDMSGDMSGPMPAGRMPDVSGPAQAAGVDGMTQMGGMTPPGTDGAPGHRMALQTVGLSTGHGRRVVTQNLNLSLPAGEVLCLLGANGAGKTTLLRTLLGIMPPLAGEVFVGGQPVAAWSRRAFAQHVGYVPQAQSGVFPFSVLEVVLMGRAARIGRFATPGRADRERAQAALDSLGIAHLHDRDYTAISGGERQLALIARALVQEPVLLVMDEPTAALDFGNQIRVLTHIERLRARGMTVLMTTHQPEHALRVASRIALLGRGHLVACGPPHETATPRALASLYGVAEHEVAACLAGYAAGGTHAHPVVRGHE